MRFVCLLLYCSFLAACTADPIEPPASDPDYTVTLRGEVAGLGRIDIATPFCGRAEVNQRTGGEYLRGQPEYSLWYGNTFSGHPEIGEVTTRIVGRREVRDTLDDADLQPATAVSRLLAGGADLQPYFAADFRIDGKTYRTLRTKQDGDRVERRDERATVTFTHALLTEGSCRGGDALIIRTEIHYDGYAYADHDQRDSVRIRNLETVLYNYSF